MLDILHKLDDLIALGGSNPMKSDLSAGNTLQAMNNLDVVYTQAFRMFSSSRRLQVVNNCGEK